MRETPCRVTGLIDMKRKENHATNSPRLAPGQLWKMKHLYVRILELGKEWIRFQMMDFLGEDGVRVQTSGIDTLRVYLHSRHATLVRS